MLLILVSFAMASPDVTAAIRAETTGPNYALLSAADHHDAKAITTDEAVLSATPFFQAECAGPNDTYCGTALVATCADLVELAGLNHGDIGRCHDDRVSTIGDAEDVPPAGNLHFTYDWPTPGAFTTPAAKDAIQLRATRHSAVDEFSPSWLIPPALAGTSLDTGLRYFLRVDPGLDHIEQLRSRFPDSSIDTLTGGPETYRTAMQTKLLLQLATALAAGAAISGMLLVLIDDARRRAEISRRLTALGIAPRTIRSAAAAQYAIPILLGTPVAALLGILSLYAYIGGTTPSDNFGTAPTTIALHTALLGSVTALLCAAPSIYTLGRTHHSQSKIMN